MAGCAETEPPTGKTSPRSPSPGLGHRLYPSVTSCVFRPRWELNTLFREGLAGVLLQFNIFTHRHIIISEPDTGSIILSFFKRA